jgi:hypothetical protein
MGGLSNKQNNTKQKGWVFHSATNGNGKPTTLLVALTHEQGFLSWFFFLAALIEAHFSQTWKTVLPTFSTELCTIGNFGND